MFLYAEFLVKSACITFTFWDVACSVIKNKKEKTPFYLQREEL